MKILIINGPNINLLGLREPKIYGSVDYAGLVSLISSRAKELGIAADVWQSNHEGCIVDKIQQAYGVYDAIIINPAAYTHTSVAILDALSAVRLPTVEVHISDISSRESFRSFSYISLFAEKVIIGHGISGYTEALEYFAAKSGLLNARGCSDR